MNKKILIVDDHQILVDGIVNLIPKEHYEITAAVTRPGDALRIISNGNIDILITDIRMPQMNGIELVKQVKRLKPEVKIIILSMSDEKSTVLECIQLGVHAYITKSMCHNDLARALYQVEEGKFYLSDELTHILAQKVSTADQPNMLTPREKEILTLVVAEMSNKEIARRLFISERTVESHRKNIYRKTGQETLVGLVKFALDHCLV